MTTMVETIRAQFLLKHRMLVRRVLTRTAARSFSTATKFTQAQIDGLTKKFAAYDKDKDLALTMPEFVQFMADASNEAATDPTSLFRKFDKKKNEDVRFDQYLIQSANISTGTLSLGV